MSLPKRRKRSHYASRRRKRRRHVLQFTLMALATSFGIAFTLLVIYLMNRT